MKCWPPVFCWVDRWLQRKASARATEKAQRDHYDRLRAEREREERQARQAEAAAAVEKALAPLTEDERRQVRLRAYELADRSDYRASRETRANEIAAALARYMAGPDSVSASPKGPEARP